MEYLLWITTLVMEYEKTIVTGLVKKGYTVTAAAGSGKITTGTKDRSGVVIALVVSKSDATTQDISKDLLDIVGENNLYYHSYVISENTQKAIWNSSNIVIPDITQIPPPIPKKILN